MPIMYAGKNLGELQALLAREQAGQISSEHNKGDFQSKINNINAAIKRLGAAPAAAAAAAPAVAPVAAAPAPYITPLPQLSYSPPPIPAAPAAVTAPEAAIAPTIAAATDRANVALQQPIQAPAAGVIEDEAARTKRKLAERNFLGRITGILTGVGGAKPGSSQIGSRTLLGGTA